VQSSICSICGKTAFEEVAPQAAAPERKWHDGLENNELRKLGIGVLAILMLVGGVAFILTRTDTAPTANALPPPTATTPERAEPTSSEAAPSLAGGAKPTSGFLPGAPREVSEGLSPWETPPPIDFVTGLLLDESIDYAVDIDETAELLSYFPAALSLSELDPPELLTFDGSVDAEQIESTQPFAARTLSRDDGLEVGELWLIASSGSDAGDAYLSAARARWNVDTAVEQYAPEVGVRLWLLAADATVNLWAGNLTLDSMVLVQAPIGVEPSILTDVLKAWRRNAA
jgi:hypothetical protein